MSTTTRAAALVLGLLVVAGCTADPDPSGSTSTTPSPSTSMSSVPPSPAPTESVSESPTPTTSPASFSVEARRSADFPDLGPNLGTEGSVRVGHHTGYDRVVWQFPGPDVPNYQVQYVDQPIGDGSGDPVDVDGEAYLEIFVTSLGYPEDVDACPKEAPSSSLGSTVFAQAFAFCGGFEGMGQSFVGLDEERPFRVAVLQNPTRLVVDVQTG